MKVYEILEKSPVDDIKVGLPADSYKVQKGDNIARIYKKFKDTNFSGYSMRDAASMLMDINPEIKDPNMIYPGMVIKMPFQYMDPRTKTRMDVGADYGEDMTTENMPDQKAMAKLKQDAAQLKAMKDSGKMDINKAMPMMKNMAYQAARADMGSKMLVFFEKMAKAIKKGIDTNVYGPADLPTMQKAYDGIMAQMPQLQKMAADSKALALKYGRTDREKASLDDKGNYKGTNIKPTPQQAQQLARRTEQQVEETATSGATSTSAIASVPGNGFANGGPGTLTRMGTTKKKKKKEAVANKNG